jgi:8-oxo-dGTP pyrophosphatase MutT (NUDIX family)
MSALGELASIVVMRPRPPGFEVLLLKRAGDAYVLPGGIVFSGEDPRVAAARGLFEETGILMARDTGQAETMEMLSLAALRKKIKGGSHATEVLRSVGLTWSSDAVLPWSHWITPSIEAIRVATKIFIAELPPGSTAAVGDGVEALWIRATEAPTLVLAPSLVRTCWELEKYDRTSDVFAAARRRAEEPHPILPRLASGASGMCLLLPWDREYETAGQGESLPLAFQPKWAHGASRFVLEDRTWKHVVAPGSKSAG